MQLTSREFMEENDVRVYELCDHKTTKQQTMQLFTPKENAIKKNSVQNALIVTCYLLHF